MSSNKMLTKFMFVDSKQKLHKAITVPGIILLFALYPFGCLIALAIYVLLGSFRSPKKIRRTGLIIGSLAFILGVTAYYLFIWVNPLPNLIYPLIDTFVIIPAAIAHSNVNLFFGASDVWFLYFWPLDLFLIRLVPGALWLIMMAITDNPLVWNSNMEIAKEEAQFVRHLTEKKTSDQS